MISLNPPKNPMRTGNGGSERLNNLPKVTLEMVTGGFKPSEEHPAGPGRQLPFQVGSILFPSCPLRVPLLKSISALLLWKTDPSHAGPVPLGQRSRPETQDPPTSSFCPGRTPTPSCGLGSLWLLPLPPASSISPSPSSALHPSPTSNENQKEGEWGLERVIPFLFMGLRRSTRGKECGLSPEARSRPLRGGWVPAGLGL